MAGLLDEIDVEALPIDENMAQMILDAFQKAASVKGVRVEREAYLRKVLGKHCPEADIEAAVEETPASAGISPDAIENIANAEIRTETVRCAGISLAAGLPGGLAMAATVPLDLVQYLAHVLRIEQKLAYLYGWNSFLDEELSDADDAQYHLALIIGFASELGAIGNSVVKVGVRMAMPRFAGKLIPVVGGAVSAGLTYSMFSSGAEVMRRYFSGLPQAKDEIELSDEIIDILPE